MDVVAYDTAEPVVVFAADDVDRASATAMIGEAADLRLVDGVADALDAVAAAERVDCVVTAAEFADGTGLELLAALDGGNGDAGTHGNDDAGGDDDADGDANGGDAKRAVRGAHDTDHPVIYVPETPSVADAEAATARGATVYLPRDRAETGELRERLADVVDAYDRRRQIARERELFDALIEHAPVPLYAKDADARYVAASSYVGAGTEESPLGRTSPEVQPDNPGAVESHRDDLRVVETGEPIIDKEGRSVGVDGEVSWHRTTKHSWRTPHGEIQGLVGIVRDVTAATERERELERQRWRLQQFASFTSTELREPVLTAIGALDRAQAAMERADGATDGDADEPSIPAAADEALATVDAELDRIQGLIETLLTMARPQATAPDVEWVDLADAVDQSWGAVEGATAAFENRIDEPLEIRADADLLRRCLEHLFRTALEREQSETVPASDDDRTTAPDDRTSTPADDRTSTPADDRATATGPSADAVERIHVGLTASGFAVEADGPPVELPDEPVAEAFEYGDGGYRIAIARDIAAAHDWSFDVEAGTDGGVRFVVEDCLLCPAGLPAATTGDPLALADSGDVGGAEPPGEANREGTGWTVRGGGRNVWRDVCEFHAVWATVEGDARVEARVAEFEPVQGHSKAGVGFYDPGNDAAPLACVALDGTEHTESIGRRGTGEPIETHTTEEVDGSGCYYRVDRVGDRAILSTSPDGVDWSVVDHRRIAASEDTAAGLFVCSHSTERRATATFEDVRVVPLEVSE